MKTETTVKRESIIDLPFVKLSVEAVKLAAEQAGCASDIKITANVGAVTRCEAETHDDRIIVHLVLKCGYHRLFADLTCGIMDCATAVNLHDCNTGGWSVVNVDLYDALDS